MLKHHQQQQPLEHQQGKQKKKVVVMEVEVSEEEDDQKLSEQIPEPQSNTENNDLVKDTEENGNNKDENVEEVHMQDVELNTLTQFVDELDSTRSSDMIENGNTVSVQEDVEMALQQEDESNPPAVQEEEAQNEQEISYELPVEPEKETKTVQSY